jgi:hypothetical protein
MGVVSIGDTDAVENLPACCRSCPIRQRENEEAGAGAVNCAG